MKGEGALLGPGGSVLAVDDQQENLELIQEILGEAGYRVRLASDGEAALREVEREAPDCIVLDVMMPRLDGFEVCRRLKAGPATRFIPVVMLTALSEVKDKVRGLDAGADDFLNKPVRSEELLARVRSLVRIRRLREELDTAENVVFTMVRALESKDPRSAGHSERVASAAMAAARSLGLGARELEAVCRGALLHDLGKLGVSEEVLLMPRPLPPEREAEYRRHPELGERILLPLRSFAGAREVVRHHHERLDGSGYPDGLKGEALSLASQVVAAANAYDDLLHADGVTAADAAERVREMARRGQLRGDVLEAVVSAGAAALQGGGARVSDPWRDLAPPVEPDHTGTVLVCDDTRGNREVFREMLEGAGLTVVTVEKGSDVVAILADVAPDLLLLDIRVPGVDGFDVCEWVKRNPETELVPVILVTALTEPRDRSRAAQVGADDFLITPVNRLELVARVRSLLRLRTYYRDLEDHQSVVLSLASVLEAKDPYTRGHSARVGDLAARLALKWGLSPEDCELMRVAGLLHDIGKVGVPESVLNKRGRLTEEEFRRVMAHPGGGESLCRPLRTVQAVLPLIRSHHERYDGKGYPDGLKGDEIPLGARVLALADAFDALTSVRSYRGRLSDEEALETLARETVEGHWDPAVYAALAAMVRRPAAG